MPVPKKTPAPKKARRVAGEAIAAPRNCWIDRVIGKGMEIGEVARAGSGGAGGGGHAGQVTGSGLGRFSKAPMSLAAV